MKVLTALIVFLSLAGSVTASLALREHYDTGTSPCSINDRWDCGIVNHSPFAEFHGIPVAIIGIVGYSLLAALAGRFPYTTLAGATLGLIFSLRLTRIEWKVLHIWCVYCVSSLGIIVMIWLLALASVILVWRRKRIG